ncbi:D-alanyl-D-alanine carboxypeptidase/D-alanyl-D-alanine endopeptidase [Rugosimonospora africana]|uniref:D-alanyl-D-alanine carboxypeptidase n=1 Tax=Rugosimonospora africana TaxID=556532 RepID=A0A8J3QWJ6_9ACTN|nr:D-alanyl-D-alanine carboxypeptidase/D-alanyl-D-alanine-endopeptidase [Rugosimonospora africana]GIH18183.1 D-alanyl-D-alanine carboxypeptidase [Rugosimonospora africana]
MAPPPTRSVPRSEGPATPELRGSRLAESPTEALNPVRGPGTARSTQPMAPRWPGSETEPREPLSAARSQPPGPAAPTGSVAAGPARAGGPVQPPEPGLDQPVPPANRRRLWIGLAAALLVLVVVATGLITTHPGGFLGARSAPTADQPSATPPAAPSPVLATEGADGPVPTAGAVSAALRGPLADSRLGSHVAVRVADASTGAQLFAQHATDPTTPASTMKLATTVALLALRGPEYQLPTRVVVGTEPGTVVIIGGGDPTLASGPNGTYPGAARLDDLAAQVKRALGDARPTKVIYDSSLFSGSNFGPGWEASDVDDGGQSARITALMTDGGRIDPSEVGTSPRYPKPDLAAAQQFAKLLGVPNSAVVAGTAPPDTGAGPSQGTADAAAADASPAPATQLGVVKSPPLVSLLEQMLSNSDNTIAEMMARQVALVLDKPVSFAGGAAAVMQELGALGLPMGGVHIVDGSGLSHQNQLTPALLTGILALAARPDQPRLHSLFTGLPVAGYSGTLLERFATPSINPADGDVRAKTGTLTGVSALAGYVTDAQGHLLVFAAMADHVVAGTFAAEEALDQIGIALARVS